MNAVCSNIYIIVWCSTRKCKWKSYGEKWMIPSNGEFIFIFYFLNPLKSHAKNYLFIYLFICLFVCLFIYLFIINLVSWTEQLRIGFYDDNFCMLHQNSIRKRQQSRKGNFTLEKLLKCLSVYSDYSKSTKTAGNTQGRFSFRAKKLPHPCTWYYLFRLGWQAKSFYSGNNTSLQFSQDGFYLTNKHKYLPWPLRNLCFFWFSTSKVPYFAMR